MLPEMDHQVSRTLEGFGNSKITVVEWETPLLRRLGYPLASKWDLIFLVPDNQLQEANDIAIASGLKPAQDEFPIAYLSEFAKQGSRYVYGEPKSRFMLVPLSWTGIEEDELSTIATTDGSLPCTIWTVPLPAFCAAHLRIIVQESRGSRVRDMAIADLAGVIAYSMFDMSYEGSYMTTPEDHADDEAVDFQKHDEDDAALAEKDALEMKDALNTIRGWCFRKNEDWNRDTLIQLVSGKLRYEELPSNET
ncbi:hypothetical protein CT0861_01997 [Colletotrichum tofieldiae]|uniref:Uncharacterized protein n=1 Tax=Colletotrichum tofieldiae TaxID=708197 RepID=A0A166PTU8_9PEZI|nr:hypothetical protein CT0861_01997 [Colletotrichum tofieldiae]GKT92624.1 hypothetical protein Ct61P_10474 [Colletotrichum tofieldiae]